MSGRTSFAQIKTLAALCFAFYASSAAASDVIANAGLFTVKIVTAIAYPFEQEFKGTASGAGFLVDRERGSDLNERARCRTIAFVRAGKLQ